MITLTMSFPRWKAGSLVPFVLPLCLQNGKQFLGFTRHLHADYGRNYQFISRRTKSDSVSAYHQVKTQEDTLQADISEIVKKQISWRA